MYLTNLELPMNRRQYPMYEIETILGLVEHLSVNSDGREIEKLVHLYNVNTSG